MSQTIKPPRYLKNNHMVSLGHMIEAPAGTNCVVYAAKKRYTTRRNMYRHLRGIEEITGPIVKNRAVNDHGRYIYERWVSFNNDIENSPHQKPQK